MSANSGSFPPGKSGNPSGRPLGAKNKIRHDVAQICKDMGCNPFEALAAIVIGDTEKLNLITDDQKKKLTLRLRLEAAAELAQYLAPKLKSVEVKGDEESPFSITINTKKCNCQSQNNNLPKSEDLAPALMAS